VTTPLGDAGTIDAPYCDYQIGGDVRKLLFLLDFI
jgi:hypothetical protein